MKTCRRLPGHHTGLMHSLQQYQQQEVDLLLLYIEQWHQLLTTTVLLLFRHMWYSSTKTMKRHQHHGCLTSLVAPATIDPKAMVTHMYQFGVSAVSAVKRSNVDGCVAA